MFTIWTIALDFTATSPAREHFTGEATVSSHVRHEGGLEWQFDTCTHNRYSCPDGQCIESPGDERERLLERLATASLVSQGWTLSR